jgi:hypothetical protein
LSLTSLTSGGRSVAIVRSRTDATEFLVLSNVFGSKMNETSTHGKFRASGTHNEKRLAVQVKYWSHSNITVVR